MAIDLRTPAPPEPGPAPLLSPHHAPKLAVALPWAAVIVAVGVAGAVWVSPYLLVAAFVGLFLAAVYLCSPGDPATVVALTVLTGFVVPARYIVEALGDAGAPVTMLSVGCFAWWLSSRVAGTAGVATGYNPVRLASTIFLCTMLVAYVAAWMRPLTGVEGRNADRTLIIWIGYLGVALLCADGVLSRDRLDTLLRRAVWGATYMSAVGAVDFLVGVDLATLVVPPGLSYNTPEFTANFLRADFTRVAGTTGHPIEFSVVGAAMLPLAVHYAFNDRHRSLLARWSPVALIGLAIPMSVSRAGMLGMALVGLVMLPALPPARRLVLMGAGMAGAAATMIMAPGLMGTIRTFFLLGERDSSISVRTLKYEMVGDFFERSPIFGQGFATFVPSEYDFLDNQYLLSLVEGGLVGLFGLLVLFLVAIGTARVIRRRALDTPTRDLAQALTASLVVHFVTFGTYDGMVFRTSALTLFLVIGAAGALWRMTPRPVVVLTQPPAPVEADRTPLQPAEIGSGRSEPSNGG